MQKGGVLIKEGYNPQTAIGFFIENSTCQVFSIHSSGGILFKLTLNAGVISPYSATRSNYPNVDIKEIIFKIVFISDNNQKFQIVDTNRKPLTNLSKTTTAEFINEVSTQIDIFTRSLEGISISEEINVCYLEPICPSIVYTGINTHAAEILEILEMLQNRGIDQYTKNILIYIIRNRGSFSIGFIAMEMMTGFITLDDYIRHNPGNAQMAKQMAMFEIARLFALGYIHGDLNLYNILFHPNYIYFGNAADDSGPLGRALLIDFGASFLHGKDTTSNPGDLYSAVKHSITMNSPKFANIEDPCVKDDRGLAFWWPHYQWLKLVPDQEIMLNQELYNLHEEREKIKRQFVLYVLDISEEVSPGSLYVNPFPRVSQVPVVEMLGGKDSSLILHQLHTTLPLHTKELDTTLPLHTKELDTTSSTENIFAKLDPEHKLNVEFITDYVKKEKALQQEILESIQQKKGGKKRNKKSKTRKSKTRKSKTKRIYK
jgi:hypothetical protein